MADSLVDLKAQVDGPTTAAAESVGQIEGYTPKANEVVVAGITPTVEDAKPKPAEPEPRGDDVIAAARQHMDFTDDQHQAIQLFTQSKKVLDSQIEANPAFGQKLMESMAGAKGGELAMKVIDAADNLKIQYLKNTNAAGFNAGQAANAAFLNTATFGQLSRIAGYAGALIQGRPAEEVIKEEGERIRLLQKAFPNYDIAGKAAAFMIPGSPVKALFTRAAGLTGKAAGAVLSRVARNPGLWSRVAESAAAGAGGSAATGAVTGTAGSGNQQFSFDRGVKTAEDEGMIGGLGGAMVPLLGAGLVGGARAVGAAGRGIRKVAGKVVEELTKTPTTAMRAYNRIPGEIKAAAGSASEAGADLVDFVTSYPNIAEIDAADKLADQLPDVPATKVLDYLRSFKKNGDPDRDAMVDRLHEWARRFEAMLPNGAMTKDGKIPASIVIDWKQQLQQAAKDSWGKTGNGASGEYLNAVKIASRRARISVIDEAKAIVARANAWKNSAPGKGAVPQFTTEEEKRLVDVAKTYTRLMKDGTEKVKVLDFIRRQLGSTPEMMAQRAAGFSDRVFGKNKEFVRARLADLDAKFGTDFLERMKLAQQAEDLGRGGVPSYFSNHTTGKSTMGTVVGKAVGGAVGGVIGLAAGDSHGGPLERTQAVAMGMAAGALTGAVASSPRMGALIIGSADNISGFLRRMAANPEAIARLAGQAAKRGDEYSVAKFRVPAEIRKLAEMVNTTLVKDGPESAGGVLRLIADTPFFAGLVHYFDLADRARTQKNLETALQRGNQ